MRNLQKYPVTKEEIITFLDSLIEEYDYTKTHMVGDMRPLLLAKAKELIQRGRFDAF